MMKNCKIIILLILITHGISSRKASRKNPRNNDYNSWSDDQGKHWKKVSHRNDGYSKSGGNYYSDSQNPGNRNYSYSKTTYSTHPHKTQYSTKNNSYSTSFHQTGNLNKNLFKKKRDYFNQYDNDKSNEIFAKRNWNPYYNNFENMKTDFKDFWNENSMFSKRNNIYGLHKKNYVQSNSDDHETSCTSYESSHR